MSSTSWIVHICETDTWEAFRQSSEYRASSLDSEGFIHASRPDQVLATANRYYQNAPPLVLLWIDPELVHAKLSFDPVGEDHFPHIYGPLNLGAVRHVTPFTPDDDGIFRRLPLIQLDPH